MNRSLGTALVVLALCGLLAACGEGERSRQTPAPQERDVDVFAQNKRLGRGVNVFGYDPGWQDPARRRMQAAHFRQIKEAGFSHVRIPLHPFARMAGAADGYRIDEKWLAVVDWAMGQALANKLMVILDCHEFHAMAQDPEGLKPKWLAFWRQMATRYADAPDSVLFELLNEPNGNLTPKLWNSFLPEALAVVRASNPQRTVVVGPGGWNSTGELRQLALPEDDRRLLVTVHYYDPHRFTHQGASWEGREKDVGYEWRATEAERHAIEREFQTAQQWGTQHQRPIFLGEFGVYDAADMASRVRWTSFVARTAESHGWSWAYWQFDSDFIVYDIDAGKWVRPIRDALIPPAP
jgi:endoglucanase